jgi:hypothetical protein
LFVNRDVSHDTVGYAALVDSQLPIPSQPLKPLLFRKAHDILRNPSLQVMSIMTECWSQSPLKRPAFHELERRLEGLDPCDAVSAVWVKSLRVDGTKHMLKAMSR